MTDEAKKTVQYLETARDALLQQQETEEEVQKQTETVKKMEQNLEQENAAVEESIQLMTRKRRGEIEKHYDKQTETLQGNIRRTKNRREKARSKGMKSRMKDETEEIRQKNQSLQNEIHTLFQQNRIPRFCNSWVYYALYYPRKVREVLFLILFLIVAVGLLPRGVWFLFFRKMRISLTIVLYVAYIFILALLYILINNLTKARHNPALKQAKKIRESIAANEKQIRAITTGIRRDSSDEMYGLGEYDEKLAKLEQDNADILREKKEALDQFDRETSESIRTEILSNNAEHLDSLEEQLKEAQERLEKLQEDERYWGRKLGEKFGNELGTEFMDLGKLDLLIQAFEDGAANMMEAQERVRKAQSEK